MKSQAPIIELNRLYVTFSCSFIGLDETYSSDRGRDERSELGTEMRKVRVPDCRSEKRA